MSTVHIHAPATTTECSVNFCPVCQRSRRMLVQFAEWYGATITCTGCGDQWSDGEMHERPFARGWRQESIRYARQKLATIGVTA